jgi:protein TonB
VTPDPTTKQAQRLWPRWFIAGTKPVKIDLGPAGSGPLVDIGGGGFRVQSLAPLRRGAEVPVRIDIPDRADALQCSGIVVWSKPNGAAGIRFTSLNESQKTILNAWLSELESAATSPAPSQVQDEFTTVVSQIRGAQLNNADALNMIVRRVNGLSSVSGASLALGTPENMVCMAAAGEAPKVGSVIPAVIGLTGECVFKRKTVHSEDSKNDPRVGREAAFGSAVILPLIVNSEVRGVLEAFSKRAYAFTPSSIEALEKFADAVIFVTHGIVTQRRLATAKPSLAVNNTGLGPKSAVPAASVPTPSVAPSLTPVESYTNAATSLNPMNPMPVVSAVPMSTPVQTTAVEVIPMAASIAAPVAAQLVRSKSFEWEERRRAVPTAKPPARWQQEQQSKGSPMLKWTAVAAVVLAVSAFPAWRFVKNQHQTISTANAEPLNTPSTTAELKPTQATPISQSVAAISVPIQPVKSEAAPVIPTKVAREVDPPAPKHELKAAAVAPPPAPEPIVLAANASKSSRPLDLDNVVPVKLPAAIVEPGAASHIALPATAKSAPNLATPVAEVRTGGTPTKRVNPVYPPLAKSAGIRGTVELQVHVNMDGAVDKVRTLNGQPMLANAAMEAVKQWRFDPAKINGKPVEMETTVRLNFDLQR